MEAYIHTKTYKKYTHRFFAIAKNWKPKCQQGDKLLWMTPTMEYFSASGKNEIVISEVTKTNLKIIILTERNQTKL